MVKNKITKKGKYLKLAAAFLFPLSLFGGIALKNSSAYADSSSYSYSYEESVSVTNASFVNGATPYASGNSLSGWNAIETSSKATGMIINVGTGESSDDSENATFTRYQETYMLNSNPGAKGTDQRILMINSKHNIDDSNTPAQKGYRSSTISLEKNSFYRFKVSAKTSTNGDESVNASIYVSGLTNLDNENFSVGYENITTAVWKEHFIFISTGNKAQSVNIDLYLGSANGQTSYGAVFFDDIHVDKLSENAFFENCYYYGYENLDNISNFDANATKFLVNSLKEEKAIVDTSSYNFDFEDEIAPDSNTLGDKWAVIQKNNGHAIIADIKNMQVGDFNSLTGYDYIGTDLSYNNNQSLIMFTKDENGNAKGYVGVKSKDIDINAHQIYKISLFVKISSITDGSFYVKLQENDKIYNVYQDLISSDKNAENYYAKQSQKTSGITSNKENPFTNDYQQIDFFVKGHSLYNSSINLELWLGDESASAKGLAIVDNITVERASYDEFNSATNKFELKSFSSVPSTVENGYFNDAIIANNDGKFPITASKWTPSIESEKKNVSGIVYLYDQETYNNMYVGSYSWAGIFPGQIDNTGVNIPNNVYMMYNKDNSYQSIKSTNYTVQKNNYYNLSFNYYNQNITGYNDSKLKIEIFDENGILLYSKDNITSQDRWNEMNIAIHTAENTSNNIYLVAHLGTEDDKVAGIVYLDNFVYSGLTEEEYSNAFNKVDLGSYYLNLSSNSDITSSPAYAFSGDGNSSIGGTVSGNNNPYVEINNDLAIDDSNYLAISTLEPTTASLTSNYNLTLEANNFYKLTFDLATIFNDEASDVEKDFGASIAINGFDAIKNLKTDSELKSYTIYFKSSSTANSSLIFSLVSESEKTIGTALLTHINFTAVTENEYKLAKLSNDFDKTIFAAKETNAEDETEPDDKDDEKDADKNSEDNSWLLIPSIITAVALVIALIAWAFRHVRIKKIEKIKKESYDRQISKNHDEIYKKAIVKRDEEVKELSNNKKLLEDKKASLEEEHKAFIKENNISAQGKISKDVERKFKEYNNNKRKLDEKIRIIDEQISEVMSSDYLVSIERKIVAEEDNNKK